MSGTYNEQSSRLKNQKGSVLIMAIIMAAIFATVAASLISRYVDLVQSSQRYAVNNENLRVGDEFAKIVSHAYEYSVQLSKAGGTCGGTELASGTTKLCFVTANNGNCVTSYVGGSTQLVCLNLNNSNLIAHADGQIFHKLDTTTIALNRPVNFTPSTFSYVESVLIPRAYAGSNGNNGNHGSTQVYQTSSSGPRPPPPDQYLRNTGRVHTCGGAGANPSICQYCGSGKANLCYEVQYCSVGKGASCATSDIVKIDMMVQR